MKLLAWIRVPFAWKVVRQYDGYTYFENAVRAGAPAAGTAAAGAGSITNSCDRAMSLTGRSAVGSTRIYLGSTVSVRLGATSP